MRRAFPTFVALGAMLLALFAPVGRPSSVAAAEPYSLATTASYAVRVDDRAIAVSAPEAPHRSRRLGTAWVSGYS